MYIKDKFTMLLTNLQSAKNKLNSLQSIVNSLSIDVLIANETHLKSNDKFKLEGYTCFSRNRQDAANTVFHKITELDIENPETILKKFNKELKKIKHTCFGKVTTYSKTRNERQLDKLLMKKINIVNSDKNGEQAQLS